MRVPEDTDNGFRERNARGKISWTSSRRLFPKADFANPRIPAPHIGVGDPEGLGRGSGNVITVQFAVKVMVAGPRRENDASSFENSSGGFKRRRVRSMVGIREGPILSSIFGKKVDISIARARC